MPDPTRVIREPISRSRVASIAKEQFGDMVKVVVDVRRHILATRITAVVAALITDG